jgi:hypothetical protein
MTGLRAPVCGLHNSGVVTHDGTRNLGKVSVKDFVFVGGFGCAEDNFEFLVFAIVFVYMCM